MVNQVKVQQGAPTAERVQDYRAAAFLSGIESRVMTTEFCWSHRMILQNQGDRLMAGGALRAGLDTALGLAITPAETLKSAREKIGFLDLAGAWLAQTAGAGERLAALMLVTAARTEARHWGLPQGRARIDPASVVMKSRLGTRFSPAVLDRYRRHAEPQDLTSIAACIEQIAGDIEFLDQLDEVAAAGAVCELAAAALHALATPSQSINDLDVKRDLLKQYSSFFTPGDLSRPMVEAVMKVECRDIGATPEQVASIRSVLPRRRP